MQIFLIDTMSSKVETLAISNHNVGFNCQGFDFLRHSIYKKDLHNPMDSKYSADHSLILPFPLVTCTEETVYSKQVTNNTQQLADRIMNILCKLDIQAIQSH